MQNLVKSLGIQGQHVRVLGQKAIWMLIPWPTTKYIIKGKVVASPQVRAMVSLVSLNLPMVHLSTKSAPTMHLLFGLCKFM
jgi:hypothetical protein